MIIDASDTILGRLASFVAKKALEGENIIVVNCEKAIISGNKDNILEEFKEKRERGDRYKGPFYPRMPDRIVRRVIRGMLPYKQEKGRKAFKRVMTYIGVPDHLKDKEKEFVHLNDMKKDKLKDRKYVYLEYISRQLGARV